VLKIADDQSRTAWIGKSSIHLLFLLTGKNSEFFFSKTISPCKPS